MDSVLSECRSLPPLVEGKTHGYLKLVIDGVIWSRRHPGDVTVIASWWGELDSAQFRPIDLKTEKRKQGKSNTELYAIKTNYQLFQEYIKNSESLELVIIQKETHKVIGTTRITDLPAIFNKKPYFRYLPINNGVCAKIGEIHVAIILYNMKSSQALDKTQVLSKTRPQKHNSSNKYTRKDSKNMINSKLIGSTLTKTANDNDEVLHKPVLKDNRIEHKHSMEKFNIDATDKYVAQVVARAQRLRGAIMKRSQDGDPLALSENSTFESSLSDIEPENEVKLYEYIMGKDMCSHDERKALDTLRSISPPSSFIDFATESLKYPQKKELKTIQECVPPLKIDNSDDEQIATKKPISFDLKQKDIDPLNYIDSLRVAVESLTLTSAGYRRVRSSCLTRGDGALLSVMYFVQYDPVFARATIRRKMCDKKPVKISSRKQIGQVIYFNHSGVYNISKSWTEIDLPLMFKVFHRHLNQQSPTELGTASIYVKDLVDMKYLGTTQKLAVINKGIKVAELKVTVELGCDSIHFGQDFVDALCAEKENIPVDEIFSFRNKSECRYRTATGTESKSSAQIPPTSKRIDCLGSSNNSGSSNEQNVSRPTKENSGSRVTISTPEDSYKNKVLLHGLIYIAEGKDLPALNTYLICRAFWREDKAASQLCVNTEHPSYQFHQLVPLIHGHELLDRTKDNCIVTEVYRKDSDSPDRLLGLAKLPIHQLYVAFRDPQILPHLLLSEYPVISVDGWVPTIDPVTGHSCGQLLALVALGTADQIAHLEISRGLRPPAVARPKSDRTIGFENQQVSQVGTGRTLDTRYYSSSSMSCNDYVGPGNAVHAQEPVYECTRSQECQTEITTMRGRLDSDAESTDNNRAFASESATLHTIVDRLAQALNIPKPSTDQAAQTDVVNLNEVRDTITEEQLSPNFHNLSDSSSSSNGSRGENFHIPIDMHRSVGVGAEFDDPMVGLTDSQGAVALSTDSRPQQAVAEPTTNVSSHRDDASFRAVVEIECALHLPYTEKPNESSEPCTYVTFQQALTGSEHQFGTCTTNVCMHSCNPKWEWRRDTRLSTDLMINDEKRLIFKIWRLIDPETRTSVDLDKDLVIGFSAIDLSVLRAGFPLISGWFHIMDFSGKCNGQLKVSVTPLENISSYVKSNWTNASNKRPANNVQASNGSSRHPVEFQHNAVPTPDVQNSNPGTSGNNQINDEPMLDLELGIGDASMSLLSQSLKQKLSELNEITKRLKSRLHDVTVTAFDEDFDEEFDNVFDVNDQEGERESNTSEKADVGSSLSSNSMLSNDGRWLSNVDDRNHSDENSALNRNQFPSYQNEAYNPPPPTIPRENHAESSEANGTDAGYSTGSNVHSSQSQNSSGGFRQTQYVNGYQTQSNSSASEQNEEMMLIRGTRVHINHLLDKLSRQLNPSTQAPNIPVQKNVMDLLSSLRQNKNFQNQGKCSQELNTRTTMPSQTNSTEQQNHRAGYQLMPVAPASQDVTDNSRSDRAPNDTSQKQNRISTVIREELVAEEANETGEYDELSTHLITSNVRHMDMDTVFKPLLYHHLIPDVDITSPASGQGSLTHENSNATTDGEAIQELESRYTENFNIAINNGLMRLQNFEDANALSVGDNGAQGRNQQRSIERAMTHVDTRRLAPAGDSEYIDGNIDVTVVHKSDDDDIMDSNSAEPVASSSSAFNIPPPPPRSSDVDEWGIMVPSESSVSTISRQAPDGGNPTEESNKPQTANQLDTTRTWPSDI